MPPAAVWRTAEEAQAIPAAPSFDGSALRRRQRRRGLFASTRRRTPLRLRRSCSMRVRKSMRLRTCPGVRPRWVLSRRAFTKGRRCPAGVDPAPDRSGSGARSLRGGRRAIAHERVPGERARRRRSISRAGGHRSISRPPRASVGSMSCNRSSAMMGRRNRQCGGGQRHAASPEAHARIARMALWCPTARLAKMRQSLLPRLVDLASTVRVGPQLLTSARLLAPAIAFGEAPGLFVQWLRTRGVRK